MSWWAWERELAVTTHQILGLTPRVARKQQQQKQLIEQQQLLLLLPPHSR